MSNGQSGRVNAANRSSRREFLSRSGTFVAASTLAGVVVPRVHAAEDNTIRLALIGCGGRGSGAVVNAFEVPNGNVQLFVMADLFADRLERSHKSLTELHPDKINVPPDRRFVGFDSYKRAMDLLRPGDVALLTGYAGWRPVQLEYAVARGVNVFMEKSFATDPPGIRRVIKAGEEAEKKNLKIAAGLMCRHSRNRQELIKRIRDGEMGDLQAHPRLSDAAGWTVAPQAGRRGRVVVADSELCSLLLGIGRLMGRDGHSPDRRDLLAEGCLAGVRARRGRPRGQ